jgi:hypothetical protein
MACWKVLQISHPPKKFQKFHLQIGIAVVCPKSLNSIYGTYNPLGIKLIKCAPKLPLKVWSRAKLKSLELLLFKG